MGTPVAGGRTGGVHGVFALLIKEFYPVLIKLGEYVGGHNISTTFFNQPNPPGIPEICPMNCPKTE